MLAVTLLATLGLAGQASADEPAEGGGELRCLATAMNGHHGGASLASCLGEGAFRVVTFCSDSKPYSGPRYDMRGFVATVHRCRDGVDAVYVISSVDERVLAEYVVPDGEQGEEPTLPGGRNTLGCGVDIGKPKVAIGHCFGEGAFRQITICKPNDKHVTDPTFVRGEVRLAQFCEKGVASAHIVMHNEGDRIA